jgi:hypothetical protein
MTAFPQNTIAQIVDRERAMIQTASAHYGEFYEIALSVGLLLTQYLKSVDPDRWVFAAFQALAKKHVMLAVFSTVRLHKVQAMMDLRQAVEAGACAAYAIGNPDHTHFVDTDEHGILDPSQKLARKRYKWLDQNYPNASKAVQEIKDKINTTTAHANLISAYGASQANQQEGWFQEPFFDTEDAHFVKTDLWMIANAALTLMHVFYEVNEKRNVIKFVDNFWTSIQQFGEKNEGLRQQMMATDRFKRAAAMEQIRKSPS